MLVEPRHDLDEIAGTRAVIELGGEDAVPGVAAGARRSRQAEDKGRPRYADAPFAFGRRKCSSRRGMISTKLQGRVR